MMQACCTGSTTNTGRSKVGQLWVAILDEVRAITIVWPPAALFPFCVRQTLSHSTKRQKHEREAFCSEREGLFGECRSHCSECSSHCSKREHHFVIRRSLCIHCEAFCIECKGKNKNAKAFAVNAYAKEETTAGFVNSRGKKAQLFACVR